MDGIRGVGPRARLGRLHSRRRALPRILCGHSSRPKSATGTVAGPTAASDSLAWCEPAGIPSIAAVRPLHVATWIEARSRDRPAPTAKQQLTALRHLFDRLVVGQVAAVVRRERHHSADPLSPIFNVVERYQA
jgi:hypothetical protein